MTDTSKRTPGPWNYSHRSDGMEVYNEAFEHICTIEHFSSCRGIDRVGRVEDAQFIVLACNAHDDLLDAARQVAGDIDGFLNDEWDGNVEGWQALSDRLHSVID